MAYKPTGRPAGRPNTTGKPPRAKKKGRGSAKQHVAENLRVRPGRQPRGIKGANGLSPLHNKVVHEYFLNGFSQKKALLSAGYSLCTAETNSDQIFKREDVQREIQRRLRQIEQRQELTAEWIKQRLMDLADANIGSILMKLENTGNDLSMLTERERYQLNEFVRKTYVEGKGDEAIPVYETKIKAESRKGALDSLARIEGLFKDKVEVVGKSVADLLMEGRKRVNQEKEE